MACIEDENIPWEIRRVINNGYFVEHPFKGANLLEMMSIFRDVQRLNRDQFRICAQAIQDRIQNESCVNCHGKGLAYLKLVSAEKHRDLHLQFSKIYAHYITLRDDMRDFEAELLSHLSL